MSKRGVYDCEGCNDRAIIAARCASYRLRYNDLVVACSELEARLDDIASGKDTDLALLEKAQAQAAAERIEMLEKQHEKDEQEKVALRALNKRFLDEIRSTKFNLCVLMDQLASAGKEREQLKLTLQCHETAQKILLGKVEQYEEYFSKKI
jgi:hypothetical protein